MNILDFMAPHTTGLKPGFKSLIDGKLFVEGTQGQNEDQCQDHVERLLRDQDGDTFDGGLTLEQRQAIWKAYQ